MGNKFFLSKAVKCYKKMIFFSTEHKDNVRDACLLARAHRLKGMKILIRSDKQTEKCFMANNLSEVILQWLLLALIRPKPTAIEGANSYVVECTLCIYALDSYSVSQLVS